MTNKIAEDLSRVEDELATVRAILAHYEQREAELLRLREIEEREARSGN